MLTDPISDYLTRIRNALEAEHEEVVIPSSRLKREMTRILKEQGYISDFEVAQGDKGEVLQVKLRYTEDRDPVISGMERVSRPGRRRYVRTRTSPASSAAWAHDRVHIDRSHDRPRGPQQGRRRRGRGLRLVI